MIVLVKDIPAYAFSSGLNELVFATDQNKAVFSLTVGEKEILSETYIPDTSGRITINDLQGLIEPYLVTNLIERCSYRITDGSSEQNKNFTVQFCAAESSMPAADFMAGYFLSTLMGEKVTATCVYYRDEDGLSTREVSLRQVTDTDKIVTVEVSPELLVKPGFELVRYIIHAGVRTQTFSLDPDAPDVAPVLLFTNSFGCQETVYCTGTHALEPEYARSTAYTNGMFRNYRIDEIYLLEGTTVGKEITITESESKRSNDPDHLPFFTFSYRYAQRNHNILQLPRAGRVFDNTFDYTFE